jgi:molybdenum cofactor synthesis domain-containing protein
MAAPTHGSADACQRRCVGAAPLGERRRRGAAKRPLIDSAPAASVESSPAMGKTAGILLIGNEILSGKITDTNAAYLCRELRLLGVDVRRLTVIPDEVDLIAGEVAAFSRDYDLVFTSGGVGPTHDDVTMEGVARAMRVPVVRHPALLALVERFYRGTVTEARLKLADVPAGAELVGDAALIFPAVVMRNIYILPGVPEIFRQKFDALRERFRDQPFHLKSVFVSMSESTLADFLNGLLQEYPLLMLGSYPEFSNPEYKVKVTLESKDRDYLDRALGAFLGRLPGTVVVRVE